MPTTTDRTTAERMRRYRARKTAEKVAAAELAGLTATGEKCSSTTGAPAWACECSRCADAPAPAWAAPILAWDGRGDSPAVALPR